MNREIPTALDVTEEDTPVTGKTHAHRGLEHQKIGSDLQRHDRRR